MTTAGARAILCAAALASAAMYAQQAGAGAASFGASPEKRPPTLIVSGSVVMEDGSEPPNGVVIERICAASARAEGYANSGGVFRFQLGVNQMPEVDSTNNSAGFRSAPINGVPESVFWNCELRAKLLGYRSDSVSLAGRRYLDNPDVGRLVLYRLKETEGLMTSATADLAPKEARQAFEAGLEAIGKNRTGQAEKDLRKAVTLYPQHAPAWLELGKLAEAGKHPDDARAAYRSAIAADPNFVHPYVQLYRLEFEAQNWRAVVENSDALLRLNPYEFPDAFYFNSIAHLQLADYAAAAQTGREAVRTGWNVKAHYVLGVALANLQDFEGAASSLQTFVQNAPASDPAIKTAQGFLDRIAQIQNSQRQPTGNGKAPEPVPNTK